MISKKGLAGIAGGIAVAGVAAITIPQIGGETADHNDPSPIFEQAVDEPDDIADVYVWHNGTDATDATVLRYILTFGGPSEPGNPPAYDSNVDYKIHTSIDGDAATDENIIDFRFGRDAQGNFGVQVSDVPGATARLIGPVEQVLTSGPVRIRAGQYDDPFFFDFTGFIETTETGEIAISNDVADDDFAGRNITAVVIEFPIAALGGNINTDQLGREIEVWAETRRFNTGT